VWTVFYSSNNINNSTRALTWPGNVLLACSLSYVHFLVNNYSSWLLICSRFPSWPIHWSGA